MPQLESGIEPGPEILRILPFQFIRCPNSSPKCVSLEGNGPKTQNINIWGSSKPKEILTYVQKSCRNTLKNILGPLKIRLRGESPPKLSHKLAFLPSSRHHMTRYGKCQLSNTGQAYFLYNHHFWFSLKVFKRANHSYSHFPEPSADYSLRSNPRGQGGLVFQTWNTGMQINNLPMTLNKYCSWGEEEKLSLLNGMSVRLPQYFKKQTAKYPLRIQ